MGGPLFAFHSFFRTPVAHFEFGQDRLTQSHPLKPFELAHSAIKDAFLLFSSTLLGLVGFVLQNHSFFCCTSWRGETTPASMRLRPFRAGLLDPPTGWRRRQGCSSSASRVPPGLNLNDIRSLWLTHLRKVYSYLVKVPQRWQERAFPLGILTLPFQGC